jgi:flavin reductase
VSHLLEPSRALLDRKVLRSTFGAFATGVTVVTIGGPDPHGMTANSFTTVSLDPPLVLICVERSAVMHRHLEVADHFGVSVLAGDQERLARYFADRARPHGAKQFEPVGWLPGPLTGSPLIAGAAAHFECGLWRAYDGGDHTIFLGTVLYLDRSPDENTLLFLRGRFHGIDYERSGVE